MQIGKGSSVQKTNFEELTKAANEFFKNLPPEKLQKPEQEIRAKLQESQNPITEWILFRLDNQKEYIKTAEEYRVLLFRALQALRQGI